MKHSYKLTLLTLLVAITLIVSSSAAGYGLSVFGDVRKMDSNTFTDVDSLAWYFGGICRTYDKGIMDGTSTKTFDPEGNVTWSQAITIAAKIHSRYYGLTLDTTVPSNAAWYSPYVAYAVSANLLPTNCPTGAKINTTFIDRSSIAYILSRTIDVTDLPQISDQSIPDLNTIGAEFKSSVQLMYSAGVLVGKAGNRFCGSDLTTRAQMANIVSRLLMPSLRISSDSKENSAMADYEGSLENDCVSVKIGSYYYCAFKYYPMNISGTAGKQVYALYRTDGNDNATEVYTCPTGAKLSDVSSYKGKVYFSVTYPGSNKGNLMCYDPAAGETTSIFSQYAVRSYCWYDNQLFILAFTNYGYDATGKNDYISNDRYTFGTVNNGAFIQLSGPYTYYQVMDFQPYGFMDKIYFKLSNQNGPTYLYAFDLTTDQVTRVSDRKINTSFFKGHVMYFLSYNLDESYDTTLYSLSLALPEYVQTLGVFPADTARSTRSLYGRNSDIYCLAGGTGKLCRMDASGTSLTVINAVGEYNAVTFVDDKIILMPNSFITSNPNEMKVYNLSSYSARHIYGDWIGCSCWYKGARFVADRGVSVYSSTATVSTVKNIEILVTETYFAGNDLIVRAKYINNSGQKISALRMQYVTVSVNGQVVASSANDFVSMPLVVNDIQTFTFVIGKTDQASNCDLSRGGVRVEITPTFEYAIVSNRITPSTSTGGTYTISVNGVEMKSATSYLPVRAYPGDIIAIVPTPNQGNTVNSVSVTNDNDGSALTVTQTNSGYTFTMPNYAVTTTVTFS